MAETFQGEQVSYPVYTGVRLAGPRFIPWLGAVAAAVALPVFVLADWPLGGWALGAGLFAANRLSAVLLDRLARGKMQVTAVGIVGMGFIGRAWISFGLLFLFAQFVDRRIGVYGAVSFLVYFTVDMLARTLAQLVARGQDGTSTGVAP